MSQAIRVEYHGSLKHMHDKGWLMQKGWAINPYPDRAVIFLDNGHMLWNVREQSYTVLTEEE